VGIIAETFRLLPKTERSIHPTHSVCSLGPLTEEMISSHILDNTPCGQNSPFHQLAVVKGQILMLGCDLIYNTSMHSIEEITKPTYLFDQPITYTLRYESGTEVYKEYIPHNFKGWKQRYDRVAKILYPPDLVTGNIVNTRSHLIEASKLWEIALPILKVDPLFFVDSIPT
jgi:aminoglycoside 3-N-acetyltransferase